MGSENRMFSCSLIRSNCWYFSLFFEFSLICNACVPWLIDHFSSMIHTFLLTVNEKRTGNRSTALSYLISSDPHNLDCPSLVLMLLSSSHFPLLPLSLLFLFRLSNVHVVLLDFWSSHSLKAFVLSLNKIINLRLELL